VHQRDKDDTAVPELHGRGNSRHSNQATR